MLCFLWKYKQIQCISMKQQFSSWRVQFPAIGIAALLTLVTVGYCMVRLVGLVG
jgi:hypothetical protein